jgi:predicted Rossmann fold nucleotide-binding protein DprA/Smf involved in DNA uptake
MAREAELHTLGNLGLLDLHKVAFLCSRACPAALHSAIREWAIRQRENGVCVISGFHSPLERMVLQCLLPGSQPIILALACGIRPVIEPELGAALAAGRLLKVTRYAPSVSHPCAEKCFQRNRMMLELADEIVVAYASPGGELEKLCVGYGVVKPMRGLETVR